MIHEPRGECTFLFCSIFALFFLASCDAIPSTAQSYQPVCDAPSVGALSPTANSVEWPIISPGNWQLIDGLKHVLYSNSNKPIFSRSNNSSWMCGYIYGVKVPSIYSKTERKFPLVIFLHGGLTSPPGGKHWLASTFHIPEEDPYILAIPSKFEWDWNPTKVLDVITDIKSNMRIDEERIYLTGLSMGGRGTFITAAAIPEMFAAIMPLSPHHQPYSYVSLAEKISSIPIWISHGDQDKISSYQMAYQMKNELKKYGADITFNTITDGRHCCWHSIYEDPEVIKWLLSKTRETNKTIVKSESWGFIKNDFMRAK